MTIIILLNRYYLQKFLKGNYYKELSMVLHKHNIYAKRLDKVEKILEIPCRKRETSV